MRMTGFAVMGAPAAPATVAGHRDQACLEGSGAPCRWRREPSYLVVDEERVWCGHWASSIMPAA